jgi:hypothetical protein
MQQLLHTCQVTSNTIFPYKNVRDAYALHMAWLDARVALNFLVSNF